MRGRTAGRALAVAACCLLVAACSGGSPGGSTAASSSAPPPVPWSVVQTLAAAPFGSYDKQSAAQANGKGTVVVREWVDYDLEKKIVDRRIGLEDDPATSAVEPTGTRDAPSLRFVLDSDGLTMWNPSAKSRCGTPWVKMPASTVADPSSAFAGVEPTLLLRQVSGAPSLLGSDTDETVYAIGVSAVAGVPASVLQKQPTIAAELARESTPATVSVAHDGKTLTLTVDVTNAVTRLNNGADAGKAVVTWTLGPLERTVSGPGSARVADIACMG